MSTSTQRGRPIVAGYEWRIRVRATASPVLFPVGVALTAQVRDKVDAADPLTTLTTGAGITRVDDNTIEFVIAGATSAAWTVRQAVLDLVRTDVTPDQFLPFRLRVPIVQPATRGLA